jgi:8-hydroxy-5-deazaflavin:NADPH oxidoreductase
VRRVYRQLDGKIVIDITNPVDVESFDGLVTPADSSAAEELAKQAPAGAKLVKAFNTTFAGTLVDGQVAGEPLAVVIASDDEEAKGTVADLVRGSGLNPVDAAPLRRARELERLGFPAHDASRQAGNRLRQCAEGHLLRQRWRHDC